MTCPICKNRIGFVGGMCIECGYNHLTHKYDWIEVSTDVLREIVPEHIFYALVMTHKDMKKRQ